MTGGEPPDDVATLAANIDAWNGFALHVANAWRVLEHGVETAASGAVASRLGDAVFVLEPPGARFVGLDVYVQDRDAARDAARDTDQRAGIASPEWAHFDRIAGGILKPVRACRPFVVAAREHRVAAVCGLSFRPG